LQTNAVSRVPAGSPQWRGYRLDSLVTL
jgi:hypothetical protein